MDFSVDNWHELCSDMSALDEKFYGRFQCDPQELTKEKIEKNRAIMKGILTDWVLDFAGMYHRLKDFTCSSAGRIEELRTKVMEGQDKVITLQDELLKSKDEQLVSVQSTVKKEIASVQTAVKSELGNWSEAVKRTTTQTITPANLKEAVKTAACEEDRSRNIMIFGKPDAENEDLSQTVACARYS
jgi:hypothetical protein